MNLAKYIVVICCCIALHSFGQTETSNTLKYNETIVPEKASLADISWISGYWRGEAFGGITEEIWSDPLGNSMMFSFKLVVDNKIKFYETGGITEKDGTLLLQLKHFHSDFKGWEEKDETVDFKLVKLEKDKAYFDEFTFEKISDTEINVYVIIDTGDGKHKEVLFNYKKQ